MKLLTKNSDYALRALACLAREKGCLLSARQIAEAEGIPLAFTRRVLRDLTKAGIIKAREGVGGGVRLTLASEQIRVKRVVELFQGQLGLTDCVFRQDRCRNRRSCLLRQKIQSIEANVIRELEQLTLRDLIPEETR